MQIQSITYKSGSYIIIEGEVSAGAFYIIAEGAVELSQNINIPGYENVKLGVGDFFGVESALTGKREMFTAITKADCKLIVVPKNQYDYLIQKKPTLVQKIILSFSKKVRELDSMLTKISFKNYHEVTLGFDNLLHVAEYYSAKEQEQPAAFAYYHFLKNVKTHDKLEYAKSQLARLKENHKEEDLFLEEDISQMTRNVPAGTMIFSEAMPGNTMYFLQSGSVKICKISKNSEITLAVLQKGSLFGEMALLENKPRSAIAITEKDSVLLVISNENFPTVIKRQPSLITRITTVLANRLWFIYRQIANVMLPEGHERLYDALLLFMEQNDVVIDKTPVILDTNMKDLLHHTGMVSKKGTEAFQELVSANTIKPRPDGTIEIRNPVFIQNRVFYFKEKMKNSTSS